MRLKNTFLSRRFLWQKQGILDILAVMNDNTKINIELQVKTVPDWDKRQIFYLAKLYVSDLRVGENYSRLRDQDGNEFSDMLEVHVLELKKKLIGKPVDAWIQFFNSKNEEDLEMIKTKNAGIQEAIRMLREMSLTDSVRDAYEAHMKAVRDQRAREEYVRNEGRNEGISEGRIEGKAEDILDLLEEKGPVPEALRKKIFSQKDPDRLRKWLRLSAKCDSLEEFQEKSDLN